MTRRVRASTKLPSRETQILSGKQPVKQASLSSDINRQFKVRFMTQQSRDVAQLIQIQK